MTVILANPTRFASIFLTVVVVGAAPVSLRASGHGALQSQSPQTMPAKPSADVTRPGSLPATSPTADSDLPVKPLLPAQRLDVEFTDGKITVDATNASLNKVIHEVASKSGIKITGGVSDELVFGHYGPAQPSVILATLLDGTGTNLMLVDGKKGGSELILTQRVGGPTPPSPLAAALETTEDSEGRPTSRYVPPIRPFQPPAPGRGPLAIPPNFGQGSQNAPPAGSNQTEPPQSSNEQRTPQQIYEQLQNANQQRQTTSQSPQ